MLYIFITLNLSTIDIMTSVLNKNKKRGRELKKQNKNKDSQFSNELYSKSKKKHKQRWISSEKGIQ